MHDKQKAACYPAGPAAVIDQQFDAEQGKAVPDSPGRTALIFPCRNNYVLFNGRLGHGVLGSSSNKPRMTMLINWWAEKPQVTVLLLLYFSSHNCNLASHCLDLPLHSVNLPHMQAQSAGMLPLSLPWQDIAVIVIESSSLDVVSPPKFASLGG